MGEREQNGEYSDWIDLSVKILSFITVALESYTCLMQLKNKIKTFSDKNKIKQNFKKPIKSKGKESNPWMLKKQIERNYSVHANNIKLMR